VAEDNLVFVPAEEEVKDPAQEKGLQFVPAEDIQDEELKPYQDPYVKRALRRTKDIEQAMELSGGDLRFSLESTRGLDSKTAKRIDKLSKESLLPPSVVRDNLGEVEENARDREIYQMLLSKDKNGNYKYPKTATFLTDPKKMAIAKKDVKRLAEIEKLINFEKSKDSNVFEDAFDQLAKGTLHAGSAIASAPGYLHDAGKYLTRTILGHSKVVPPELRDFIKAQEIEPSKKLINNPIALYLKEASEAHTIAATQESAIRQLSDGEILKGSYNIFMQALESTPLMATMMLSAWAGAPAAATLTGMGVVEASGTYREGLERGKTPGQAMTAASISGTAEAGFEVVTLGMMSNMLKRSGKELVERFGKEGAKQVIMRSANTMLKNTAEEGVAEAATTGVQDLADYITGDKEALDGVGERMLNSFLVGGLTGGVMGAAQSGMETVRMSQEHQAKAEQDKKIAEQLDQMEDLEENKEVVEEHLNENLGGEEIQISPQALEEAIFNQSKKGPEGVVDQEAANKELEFTLEDLNIMDQVEQAKATGQDLKINRAKWLTKYANTELGKALQDDIRYGIDSMTGKEVEKAKKDVKKQLQENSKTLKEQMELKQEMAPRVKALRDFLIDNKDKFKFKMDAEYADTMAEMIIARGMVMSQKRGETLDQWLERMNINLGVEGARTEMTQPAAPTGPLKIEDLPADMQEEANSYVEDEISRMLYEVQNASVENYLVDTEKVSESDPGKTRVYENTFPKWYRKLGVKNKEHLAKVIEKKSGPIYERIRARAIKHLIEGVESAQDRMEPSKEFRELLGYEGEDIDVFEQRDKIFNLKRGERSLRKEYPVEQVVRVKLAPVADDVAIQAIDNLLNPESALVRDYYDRLIETGKRVKVTNDYLGQELTISQQGLEIYISTLKFRLKDTARSKAKFRESLVTLLNVEKLLKDAVPVAEKDGVMRLNAIGTVNGSEVVVDFKVQDGQVIMMDSISGKIPEGSLGAPLQGEAFDQDQPSDVVSINYLAQRVNKGIQMPTTYFQEDTVNKVNQDSLGYFSKLLEEVEKFKFKSAPAANIIKQIQNLDGIKAEELEWTGVIDFLESYEGKVPKEALVTYLEENGLVIEEMELGSDPDAESSSLEWSEDPVSMPVSEYSPDFFYELVEEEIDYYLNQDDTLRGDNTERLEAEARKEMEAEGLTEEEIEASLEDATERKLEELAREYAEGILSSTDSVWAADKYTAFDHDMAIWYTESSGDFYVEGPYSSEWISLDARNIEEAKIEATQKAIDETWIDETDVGTSARWEDYVMEGPYENYRELLLRLPNIKGSFTYDMHWGDIENIVTHIRVSDRDMADGSKTLFIEELQSDWHQQGRKQGYKEELTPEQEQRIAEIKAERKNIQIEVDGLETEKNRIYVEQVEGDFKSGKDIAIATREVREKIAKLDTRYRVLGEEISRIEGQIDPAPFRQTEAWLNLALKRVLRIAAEQGYDSVTWTPGEVHADRWTQYKYYKQLDFKKLEGDKYDITVHPTDGGAPQSRSYSASELEDGLPGPTWEAIRDGGESGTITEELKIQDMSVADQYDKKMPSTYGKYIKKLDKKARVGVEKVSEGGDVWYIPMTEKIVEKVTGGQPLFQNQGSGPRASVTFRNNETFIQLFNSADRSSLFHELGHIFIQDLENLVASGQADDQAVADLNTLKKFGGEVWDVEAIEKVTRGFEKYLMEGKAPSMELQSAFSRLKNWLISIYKTLRGRDLLPKINDEVRGVFDRMLATQEQIDQVQEYYSMKKSIVDLLPKEKTTQEQRDELEKKRKEADQTAEQKLLSKYMKAFIKSMGGKKGLKKTAEAEINELPIYQAIEEAKVKKLNADEVKKLVGETLFKKIKDTHPTVVTQKGEASVSEIALDNDFDSPETFLKALAEAPKKQDAVNEKVEEYIKQREDEILADLSDKQMLEGTEEDHNDQRLATLIAEYQLLIDQLPKKDGQPSRERIDAKIYKDVAKEALLRKPVKTASRYDIYAKTERKFMKLAYDHAAKGELDKAAAAMQKQILNHVMVQEAVKIRDMKLKTEKFYKTKNLQSKLKNIENDYMLQAKDLISKFNLNKGMIPGDQVTPVAVFDEGLSGQLPEWIFSGFTMDGKNNYRDMSVRDFLELDESIRAIIHTGRGALLSMKGSDLATVQQAVEESLKDMEKLDDATILKQSSRIAKFLKDSKIGRMYSEGLMLEYVYEELDNFKRHRTGEFGTMMKFQNRARELESDYKELVDITMSLAKPHLDKLNNLKNRLEEELGSGFFHLPGVPIPEIMQAEGRDTWTAEAMIAFMLNVGNEHNYEVLKRAYNLTDANVQKMASYFTVEELQAIQGIWNTTDTLYQPLDETNFRMFNRHLPKVEARPISLKAKGGEVVSLAGGYYPLSFDRSLSDVAEKHQEDQISMDRNKAVLRSGKPKDGMTKDRVGGIHSLPPLLSLSVWTKHVKDTSRYITHAEFLRDMDRLTKNEDWKKMTRKKVGKQIYTRIRDNLKYQARPERRFESGFDGFFNWARSMSTGVILGLNFGVGLKQRLSGLSAQEELGGKWLWEAFKDADFKGSILGMDKSKLWQEVRSKSKYLRAREGNMDREIHDVVASMDPFLKRFKTDIFGDGIFKEGITAKDVRDAMFFLIQANDRAMTGLVWKAAYMKAMSQNTSMEFAEADKKAIQFADAIVTQTQPSSLPLDLNALQRSEGAARLFTMFMTWTFKQGNRFIHKYRGYRSGAISRKQYIRHLVYEGLFASWGGIVISALLKEGELPEWWEFGVSPLEYAVSGVPIVRDVPRAIRFNQPLGQLTGFEVPNRILKASTTTYDFLNDDADFYDFLWDTSRAAEILVGVPATTAGKNMRDTYLLMTGQKKKKKK